MTDIIVIDIPDWQYVTAIEPVTVEVIDINGETINVSQNNVIAVGYPGDWQPVHGGGDDANIA